MCPTHSTAAGMATLIFALSLVSASVYVGGVNRPWRELARCSILLYHTIFIQWIMLYPPYVGTKHHAFEGDLNLLLTSLAVQSQNLPGLQF
jgi:hypothetical protein